MRVEYCKNSFLYTFLFSDFLHQCLTSLLFSNNFLLHIFWKYLSLFERKIWPESQSHHLLQEKELSSTLAHYVNALAEQHPFSIDIKLDERFVLPRLAEIWPTNPQLPAQAYELWECIDTIVHTIPEIATTPDILLRLSAAGLLSTLAFSFAPFNSIV